MPVQLPEIQITPRPWPGLTAPQTSNIHGIYRQGAVDFAAGTFIRGVSANVLDFTTGFTKGVVSFWAKYDSSASPTGDSARIRLIGGSGAQPNNAIVTSCSNQNQQNDLNPSGTPNAQIGCIAILLGVFNIDLYLVDISGNGLAMASLPYVSGVGTTGTLAWVNYGSMGSNLYTSPGTYFGVTYPGPAVNYEMITPCGGFCRTFSSGGPQSFANSATVPFPNPPTAPGFQLRWNGAADPPPFPTGTIFDSNANLWGTNVNSAGGAPTSGWHHYIISFDTSQLVTDQFGSQSIRIQMAMDGAGGPINNGPLYDTAAPGITLASQPFSGPTAPVGGRTGTLGLHTDDLWIINAPGDAPVQFAYCYMGVADSNASFGDNFYDLTALQSGIPVNLRRFLTATGGPQSLGSAGISVPLVPVFMHTGGAVSFSINAAETNRHKDQWDVSGLLTSVPGP